MLWCFKERKGTYKMYLLCLFIIIYIRKLQTGKLYINLFNFIAFISCQCPWQPTTVKTEVGWSDDPK